MKDDFDYNNINDMIDLIYEFLYKNHSNEVYGFEKIKINEIDNNRILKNSEFDYNEIFDNNSYLKYCFQVNLYFVASNL